MNAPHTHNNNTKIASICHANDQRYWAYWVTLNTSPSSSLPRHHHPRYFVVSRHLFFWALVVYFCGLVMVLMSFQSWSLSKNMRLKLKCLFCGRALEHTRKKKSDRMIFAFDCTDCSPDGAAEWNFSSVARAQADVALNIYKTRICVCLCATDDLLSFSFNHFNESHSYCLFDCKLRTAWCSLHSTTRDRQPHTTRTTESNINLVEIYHALLSIGQ